MEQLKVSVKQAFSHHGLMVNGDLTWGVMFVVLLFFIYF